MLTKHGKRWQWILMEFSDDGTTPLGIFGWVGGATGFVKHSTGVADRLWHSSEQGIMSRWTTGADPDTGKIYEIYPVEYNPRGAVAER